MNELLINRTLRNLIFSNNKTKKSVKSIKEDKTLSEEKIREMGERIYTLESRITHLEEILSQIHTRTDDLI